MKTYRDQANAVLKKHLALGQSKSNAKQIGNTSYSQFTSVRSFNETSSTLARVAERMGVSKLSEITFVDAQNYINERREVRSITTICSKEKDHDNLSQKTLDAERKALSILLNENLERVYSNTSKRLASRAYSKEQITEIKSAQREKNRFSTELARASGLRASELYTIQRIDEAAKTTSRKWRNDLFDGLSGEKYIVTGKGGLRREVIIPKHLADKLETYRLERPKIVYDRKVKHTLMYDLSGGNNFSKSFESASNRQLGFSTGVHGLRHSYAQERFLNLKLMGKTEEAALTIVSQELGHFRPSITKVYLR